MDTLKIRKYWTDLRRTLDIILGVVDDESKVILQQRFNSVARSDAHAFVCRQSRRALHAAVFRLHLQITRFVEKEIILIILRLAFLDIFSNLSIAIIAL